jgi:hypothetical protein
MIHILQICCFNDHFGTTFPYDDTYESREEVAAECERLLRERNKWCCPFCGNDRLHWRHIETKFKTMAEASPALLARLAHNAAVNAPRNN